MSTKFIQNFNIITCEEVKSKGKRERFQSAIAKSPSHSYQIPEPNEDIIDSKFYSSTTVPSTESSEKQTSTNAYLSVNEQCKPKKRGVSKRRIIFRHKRRRKEKSEVRSCIDEKDITNHILNMKVNYFYKPYIGENNIHDEPPMNFNQKFNERTEGLESEYFTQEARSNWNKLSKSILNNNDNDFRSFLQSINKNEDELYDDLMLSKTCEAQRKDIDAVL